MKTTINYKIAFAALFVGLGFSSFSAPAQANDHRKANKKEYKYSKKQDKRSYPQKNYYGEADFRRSDRQVHRHFNDRRFAYHHPQYGDVYKRFHHRPVRLRAAHGDIYYHSGHYYRFYPRVGYVRVAVPAASVFVELPGRYERVSYGGHLYFRVGDLMFDRCRHGYRLAPQFSLNLSAHF
ncbi:hypothetical protein [Mangrovibacterium marinum]|uniref:Nickel/cobalt transporter regulator n=1 Tax=Mangrovibacterium marinum TaxID=1639118 RepID=A0A2T5BZ47_9BACT|nr:hypothetical protein [Mangrovibacterium marinum]PTN07531.1 hypothetical protein C8N47_11656 [Mangrovibacterium marinum]